MGELLAVGTTRPIATWPIQGHQPKPVFLSIEAGVGRSYSFKELPAGARRTAEHLENRVPIDCR